jgi:hypothetical protein
VTATMAIPARHVSTQYLTLKSLECSRPNIRPTLRGAIDMGPRAVCYFFRRIRPRVTFSGLNIAARRSRLLTYINISLIQSV